MPPQFGSAFLQKQISQQGTPGGDDPFASADASLKKVLPLLTKYRTEMSQITKQNRVLIDMDKRSNRKKEIQANISLLKQQRDELKLTVKEHINIVRNIRKQEKEIKKLERGWKRVRGVVGKVKGAVGAGQFTQQAFSTIGGAVGGYSIGGIAAALLLKMFGMQAARKTAGAQFQAGAMARPSAGGFAGTGERIWKKGKSFGMREESEAMQFAASLGNVGFTVDDKLGDLFDIGQVMEKGFGMAAGSVVQLADVMHEKLGISTDDLMDKFGGLIFMYRKHEELLLSQGVSMEEFSNKVTQTAQNLKYTGTQLEDVTAVYLAFAKAQQKFEIKGLTAGGAADIASSVMQANKGRSIAEAAIIAQSSDLGAGMSQLGAAKAYFESPAKAMIADMEYMKNIIGGGPDNLAGATVIQQRYGLSSSEGIQTWEMMWKEDKKGNDFLDYATELLEEQKDPMAKQVDRLTAVAKAVNAIKTPIDAISGYMEDVVRWTEQFWKEKLKPFLLDLKKEWSPLIKKLMEFIKQVQESYWGRKFLGTGGGLTEAEQRGFDMDERARKFIETKSTLANIATGTMFNKGGMANLLTDLSGTAILANPGALSNISGDLAPDALRSLLSFSKQMDEGEFTTFMSELTARSGMDGSKVFTKEEMDHLLARLGKSGVKGSDTLGGQEMLRMLIEAIALGQMDNVGEFKKANPNAFTYIAY